LDDCNKINKIGFWALKVIKVYLGAAAALLAQQQTRNFSPIPLLKDLTYVSVQKQQQA
jgi:hypothetical protein